MSCSGSLPRRHAGPRVHRLTVALAIGLTGFGSGCVSRSTAPTTLRSASQAAPSLPASFEVVCWNVHKSRRAVAAALDALGRRASVVLLQEAIGLPPPSDATAVMAVTFRRRDGRPTGVLTVSTASLLAEQALLSEVGEPLARTPKSALITRYALADGRHLLVANVHGINFRRSGALARQLDAIEAAVRAHRGPLIVAGDFNTWSARRRRVLSAFARRLDLRRSLTEADAAPLDAVLYRGLTVLAAARKSSRWSDHDALHVRFATPRSTPPSVPP